MSDDAEQSESTRPTSLGAGPVGEPGYRLELSDVIKTFPGVQALRSVSMRVRPGEIHALVGENGAGKSTLVKIIAGVEQPDSGDAMFDGASLADIDEQGAGRLGIGMVHQEGSLVPDLSVAENIFAGRQPTRFAGIVDWRLMRRRAAELLQQLRTTIAPDVLVSTLSPAQRQMVEIAKALSFNLRLLILDEPTASLTVTESQHLFSVVRELSRQGVTTIYISHRLAEVFELADRVTVLKDGAVTGQLAVSDVDEAGLMRLMVGRDLSFARGRRAASSSDTPMLSLERFAVAPRVRDVSLTVAAGEIVCLAGLIGAGRTEVCEGVFGVRRRSGGRYRLNGREVTMGHPAQAMQHGIGMIPEDRKAAGLFLDMSVGANLIVANLDRVAAGGLVSRTASRRLAEEQVARLGIVTPSVNQHVGRLSGGNQQKVLLAKWLSRSPKLLIVDEPTRGVDVGARSDIYLALRELAAVGTAILLVSSDLPEVLTLADRIVVMAGGITTGELKGETATELDVLRLAAPRSTTQRSIV